MSDSKVVNEKRKDTRFVVSGLEVFFRDTGERLGNIINLSLSGMLISHDSSMAVDSILKVRIPLEKATNSKSDFEPDVMVKWFRQNDMSGLFGYGLEFLDNTDEQRVAIQGMIDEYRNNGD